MQILVIAVLMKWVLKRTFNVFQWEALLLLVAGITVNQLNYCKYVSGQFATVCMRSQASNLLNNYGRSSCSVLSSSKKFIEARAALLTQSTFSLASFCWPLYALASTVWSRYLSCTSSHLGSGLSLAQLSSLS